jgi:hypothetical protein
MAEYQLIVSNPPHRSPDPVAVAPHLKCSAAEVRMKLNFPAPEIWLFEPDKGAAAATAQGLVKTGANVVWIPGSVLAAAPRVVDASAVGIEGDKVVITTNTAVMVASTGDRLVAILGEPVQRETRSASGGRSMLTQNVAGHQAASGRAKAGLSDVPSAEPTELFVDVYALGGDGWKAARLTPSETDFSGLGDRKQPMARANIGAIVGLLRDDYGARVDERLMKVTYKPAIVSGLALIQVLGSISDRLAALPLLDLGSRLAFLTSKG